MMKKQLLLTSVTTLVAGFAGGVNIRQGQGWGFGP